MAYKTVTQSGAPATLDAKHKQVEGYLLAVKPGSKKFASSKIYSLQTPKGETIKVWGCAAINQALLDASGSLLPEFSLRMARLTYEGMIKIKGRKQPMRNVTVEVDDTRKLNLKRVR